jgi:cardiolipin synthase A/B
VAGVVTAAARRRRRAGLLALACLAAVVAGCARLPPHRELPALSVDDPAFIATVAAHTSAPVVDGNRVDILLDGEEIFAAMIAAIRSARRTITYSQFLYKDGPVGRVLAETLAERCRAGVGVNVLLDAFGSRNMPQADVALMRRAGCAVVDDFRPLWMLDRLNYRQHRRVLVIDGRIGFTGGFGVGTRWLGQGRERWRETDVRVEGPVVHSLQGAFAEHWLEATGETLGGDAYFPPLPPRGTVRAQVVRSAPLTGNYSMYRLFLLAIASARQSIQITTPFLVLDEALRRELERAVRRGVAVAVIVPGIVDTRLVHAAGRADFGRLLRAGIVIHRYQASLLHPKTMVIDGRWATIGTTNFDPRSFALSDEVNVVVYDAEVGGRMAEIFAADVARSRPLTLPEWRRRGLGARLFELLVRPIRQQL